MNTNKILNVLYLEDNEHDVEIVHHRLTDDLGCSVLLDHVETENDFLESIRSKSYDIILADYTLPGYTAQTALKSCRQICPETPFICVSGTIGEDVAVELLKSGATDYVLKDRMGRLSYAVSRAITEVREKIERERALALSEESNRLMLDATSDGIAMFNRDGIILNANQTFIKRMGEEKKDMVGQSFRSFLPNDRYGDLFEQRLKYIRQVFSTARPVEFEDCRDGKWFRNRFYPNYIEGKISAVTLFSADITNAKRIAEKERRNSELKWQAETLIEKERDYLEIIDSSTIGTWIYDFTNGELKYSSQWLARIGGMDNDNAKRLMIVNIIYLTNKAYAIGQTKFKTEYSLETSDHKTIWILDQGKIILDDKNRPWKIYGTSMDITERKAYEQELKTMASELERKNTLITNFFINLSHEFKTPISIILLAVEIMEMYQKNNVLDLEKTTRQISLMKQNAYRLGRLVGNLLDITKIDAGFMTPGWHSVDIMGLLKGLISSMRHLTQSKGIALSFTATSKSMTMPSDAQLIERIVLNLISNAIKHTESGGFIRVKCCGSADKIILSVRDSGEGIPDDKKSIIFDRFRQVNTSLTRSSEGCGIGLALTKSLVEMLKGSIWFESKQGVGTCFYIELPVIEMDIDSKKSDTNGMDVNSRIQMELSDIDF